MVWLFWQLVEAFKDTLLLLIMEWAFVWLRQKQEVIMAETSVHILIII